MICPVCKIGEVVLEFDDPEQFYPELSCDNEECPSIGFGIYCYLSRDGNYKKADDFLKCSMETSRDDAIKNEKQLIMNNEQVTMLSY